MPSEPALTAFEREMVQAHQNNPEFVELLTRLREEFAPSGCLENLLVLHMAAAQWGLDRLAYCESSLLSCQTYPETDPDYGVDPLARSLGLAISTAREQRILASLCAREASLQRNYRRALAQLRMCQSRRLPRKP